MFSHEPKRIICQIGLGASAVGMMNVDEFTLTAGPFPGAPQKLYFAAVSAAFDNAPDRPKRLSSESLPAPKAAT
jgi:hypothetical protein